MEEKNFYKLVHGYRIHSIIMETGTSNEVLLRAEIDF